MYQTAGIQHHLCQPPKQTYTLNQREPMIQKYPISQRHFPPPKSAKKVNNVMAMTIYFHISLLKCKK
ncbi:unnamed protein product [Timema podura]|uniref:Uncharacterized protein n=1 Tax=Timema podura TaxID=61482 RepID=A0ABN7PNT8_TIMPD|nr:unnamed protein product [Timema podura]